MPCWYVSLCSSWHGFSFLLCFYFSERHSSFLFLFVIFYLILLKCLNYWQGRGRWWNVKFLAQVILSMKTSAFIAPEHLVSLPVILGSSLPLSFLELLHSSLVFQLVRKDITLSTASKVLGIWKTLKNNLRKDMRRMEEKRNKNKTLKVM